MNLTSYKSTLNMPEWFTSYMQDLGVSESNAASLYSKVPLYFRAINLRCDALSSVPVVIQRGEKEADWPFPQPLQDLIWNLEVQLLLTGGAFAEIVRNKAGFVKDIIPVPGLSVTYAGGVYTFKQQTSGRTGIWFNEPASGRYEILYLRDYDPRSTVLPGVGAAEVAAGYARVLYALESYHSSYIQGGGLPVTVLGVETSDQNEISKLEAFFRRIVGSYNRAEKLVATPSKTVDVKTISPMPKDMAFAEMHQQARDGIANAFGIPKTLLDSEAANYATAKEDRLAFYEDKIKGRAGKIAGEINKQVLERLGLNLRFAFDELPLFQEDQADRIASLEAYRRAGFTLVEAADLAGIEITDDVRNAIEGRADAEVKQSLVADSPFRADLSRWQKKANKALKAGKSASVPFESPEIRSTLHASIAAQLESAETPEAIKQVFDGARKWEAY